MTYEFKVFEVSDNLLREGSGSLLELCNAIGVGLSQFTLDGLHVALISN